MTSSGDVAAAPKVLFLRTDPGTYDPRIRKESETLSHRGYDVTVFGWDRSGDHPRQEEIGGVTYLRTRLRAPYGSKLLLFLLPVFWLLALERIRALRPAVIHACDLDALIPAVLGKFLVRCTVVYDIFDHYAERISGIPEIVRSLIRSVDGCCMRFAEAVIVTDEQRVMLIPAHARQRMSIVMNVPRDPGRETSIDADPTLPLKVCYAGSIHECRGLHLIAEASRGLDGVEVVFAGWIPREVDKEYLLRQPHLQYLGRLSYEDSLALLASSDAALALYDPSLPINAMASSNKVFEAMMLHKVVISNRETAMARIIEEVDCGILVRYGSPESLRQALLYVRDHPEERRRLGENGYRVYREHFTWKIMEERLLELYRVVAPMGEQPAC